MNHLSRQNRVDGPSAHSKRQQREARAQILLSNSMTGKSNRGSLNKSSIVEQQLGLNPINRSQIDSQDEEIELAHSESVSVEDEDLLQDKHDGNRLIQVKQSNVAQPMHISENLLKTPTKEEVLQIQRSGHFAPEHIPNPDKGNFIIVRNGETHQLKGIVTHVHLSNDLNYMYQKPAGHIFIGLHEQLIVQQESQLMKFKYVQSQRSQEAAHHFGKLQQSVLEKKEQLKIAKKQNREMYHDIVDQNRRHDETIQSLSQQSQRSVDKQVANMKHFSDETVKAQTSQLNRLESENQQLKSQLLESTGQTLKTQIEVTKYTYISIAIATLCVIQLVALLVLLLK